nr:hypothetical protein Q903MT_gene3228 [Picea sitchensis]
MGYSDGRRKEKVAGRMLLDLSMDGSGQARNSLLIDHRKPHPRTSSESLRVVRISCFRLYKPRFLEVQIKRLCRGSN